MSLEPEKVFVFESYPINDDARNGILANLDDVENSLKICRICGEATELLMPIFEEEGLLNNLADKIHKYLPIQVSQEDSLSHMVCYACTNKLLAWHELYCICDKVDRLLQRRFTQSDKETVIESNELDNRSCAHDGFVELVKSVLNDFLDVLEGTENCDVQLVCNKCNDISAFIEDFADHLRTRHCDEISDNDRASIANFIENHVTFDETLEFRDCETAITVEAESEAAENEDVSSSELVDSFKCPRCPSWFTSCARLACHVARHARRPLQCCATRHASPRALRRHLAAAHRARAPAAACRACRHVAAGARQLAAHVRRHHAASDDDAKPAPKESPHNQKYIPAVCPTCNETFSNKYNMLKHLARHGAAPRERWQCGACARRYLSRGALVAHARAAHGGLLPHACARCAERFPTRAARAAHAASHAPAPARHACPLCPRAYAAADSLRQHLRAHADLRPHACPSCAKRFRKKSHLDYHLTTHR